MEYGATRNFEVWKDNEAALEEDQRRQQEEEEQSSGRSRQFSLRHRMKWIQMMIP